MILGRPDSVSKTDSAFSTVHPESLLSLRSRETLFDWDKKVKVKLVR